ncbi:DNA polymerase epsilon subunit 3 [Coemansia sp. RSA 921]|nr:DNA polymerase epsilon subunit 3 [Coemansia sp. RSA 1591]KAJ1775584.1 DNA polymerase epsilon subunit 3 [Coemansia sp. RSA 1824]KAJ2117345.1 DNA polymerase epsilon subunit 3 [Coemansia sp. RSA 921]
MATLEDLDFPKAVLMRMIKSSLPDTIAIQKEARSAVSKSATVFVSYLAAAANDCARTDGRKTIMPNDVYRALEAVGLAEFVPELVVQLEKHSVLVKEKKEAAAKDKAEKEEETETDDERGEGAGEAVEPVDEADAEPVGEADAEPVDETIAETVGETIAETVEPSADPTANPSATETNETNAMDIDDPDAKRQRTE